MALIAGDGRRLSPIQFARGPDCPGDARQLVGERHRDEPGGSTLEKLARPNSKRIGALMEPTKACPSTKHKKSPQIRITLFGNPAKLLLSAA